MRVAAYQAPYRPYPARGGAELVLAFLDRARFDGVELVCCPEALIGELANETDGDSPSTVALSVADGELDEAVAPLFGWGMTIVLGFTERAVDSCVPFVASAEPLREAFIVADVAIEGGAGRLDGQVDVRANPAVTDQFRALWR